MSKKTLISGLALAASLAVTSVGVFAQQGSTTISSSSAQANNGQTTTNQPIVKPDWQRGEHGAMRGMRRGFAGGFAANLNLTEAQKQQMQAIATRYHETMKALHDTARANGEQQQQQRRGFDAFDGTPFDESAVRAAAQARANRQVEMDVLRARMTSEMYAVLTPEQKSQLAAQRKEREARHQEWRARRQAENTNQQ